MKNSNNNLTTVLGDLRLINEERAAVYRSAMPLYPDLSGLFERMAEKSERFAYDLRAEAERLGLPTANPYSPGADIYRVWMAARSIQPSTERSALLRSFLENEKALQQAYAEALSYEEIKDIPFTSLLIVWQKNTLDIARSVLEKYQSPAAV